MRDDQLIRIIGIAVVGVLYVVRAFTIGNGPVAAFGLKASPYALSLAAVVLLALPETLDKIPYGRSNADS